MSLDAVGPEAAPPSRLDLAVIAALCLWLVVPGVLLRNWWVEDAGIAFSYARNLALGDGLVAFPGGERIEGYSDPLWIALLGAGRWIELDPFGFSKVLGGLFAAACVPTAYFVGRRLDVPGPAWLGRLIPLSVAALVAFNAQHAIWASAGLENALFSCLLGLGALLLVRELERPQFPWSAVVFFGLAITRPEGASYGALALGVTAWMRVGRDPLGPSLGYIARWIVSFVAPFAVYHAVRYDYFALPFAMPYYAKVVDESFRTHDWTTRSWTYLLEWATGLGWAWFLPILWIGVAGRGKRAIAVFVWAAALGVALARGYTPAVGEVRIGLMVGLAATFGLVALWRSRLTVKPADGAVRLLCTGSVVLTVAFSVSARGDWMAGYRWFSLLVVPLSLLMALGAGEVAGWVSQGDRSGRSGLAAGVYGLLIAGPVLWNLAYLASYVRSPEPMTPESTHKRVRTLKEVAATVHLERPWVTLDHAMGGQTYWAPPQGRAVDLFGLTDVIFALHRPVKDFNVRYVLNTGGPTTDAGFPFDFAHVDDNLPKNALFKRQFVPLTRAKGKTWNDWMNRSLITSPAWPGDTSRSAAFEGGPQLVGFTVRSPSVSEGLYVEFGLGRPEGTVSDLKLRVRLHGPAEATFDADLGYGMLPPAEWRPDEVYMGRYAFKLPKDLPTGDYALAFAVDGPNGPLLATEVKGGEAVDAGVDAGEARFADVVHVVADAEAVTRSQQDSDRAVAMAQAGDCDGAEAAWWDAVEDLPLNAKWDQAMHRRAEAPFGACWAGAAAKEQELSAQIADLRRARQWDAVSPEAYAVGATIADATWAAAMAARDAGDDAKALALFQAIVTADPRRSWARRFAEEARSTLLAVEPVKAAKRGRTLGADPPEDPAPGADGRPE